MNLKHIITLRDQKIQTPRLVILCMVHHLQMKTNSAFVGELSALYSQVGRGTYSYTAVNVMCNKLVKYGLLHKTKEGIYPSYSLTQQAEKLIKPFVEEF
ncbi:hypothetical protein HYP07_gp082 [Vibrio phage JSF3]|uniref:Uncharacterized protein n=1 Tax=Vibrio phage VCO139 TaxID=1283073 RepID=R9R4V1_9CAUD|nr:hypothetical protein HYO77_gp15 [Vibrio phage VCO139]YP_009876307.1 hypothetical protein HYP07_gp082 [Vibrio phage JSF3]AGI61846.1 hypothetical protein VCO139_0015 [Vibrio phage VCO139]APD18094.1 hypothetical protein [Vibrio phage JSF3]